MAACWFMGTPRPRATPLRLILVCATTAAVLSRLVSASTSVPSSSSELCPDETAACFDSSFCWDCVAQFADSSDFCEDLYPVLAVAADECEIASALFCCSFDASGQDCVGDEVTMDFFRCGLLEESGCVLSDSPCSGVSEGDSDSTDIALSTPAPVTAESDDSQDASIGLPTPAPTTAESDDSQDASIGLPTPAPTTAESDDSQDASPNAPSMISPTESTSGAAGGVYGTMALLGACCVLGQLLLCSLVG